MPAFRPVVFIGGILVLVLAATMAIPALVEFALGATGVNIPPFARLNRVIIVSNPCTLRFEARRKIS